MSLCELLVGRAPLQLPTGTVQAIRDGRPAGEPDPAAPPPENNRITKQRENRRKVLLAIAAGANKSAAICHATDLCRGSVFNHTRELEGAGLIVIITSRWANTYRLTRAGKREASQS